MDWGLIAATAVCLMIAIETQRSYSKLSPWLRKANLRVLIFLGGWGIAAAGIAYLTQAAIIASANVFVRELSPLNKRGYRNEFSDIVLVMFVIAVPVAVIRVVRQLNLEELIYHLPQRGLKNLFIYRRHKATSLIMFAYVELTLLVVCFIYASVIASLINGFVLILGLSS